MATKTESWNCQSLEIRASQGGRILLVLPLLFLAAGTLRADQPDETLPFFRPDQAFETRGIDNINLFSGDIGVAVPLSPEYLLGPTTRWQLNAYASAKFWHFSRSCAYDETMRFAYISGDPTLGVGWTLQPGFIEISDVGEVAYYAPDGSQHKLVSGTVTKDGSHLRIKSTSNPAGYTVEFPDGTIHTLQNSFAVPAPVSGASPDFVTKDSRYGTRYGLTRINDSFGNELLHVYYQGSHPWEFTTIGLSPGVNLRTITFTWKTQAVGSVSWRVLDRITFPSASGTSLVAQFAYQSGTFIRNNYDLSPQCHLPPCTSCSLSPSSVSVPELTMITLSHAPSMVDVKYTFEYNAAPTGVPPVQVQGTLKKITLPSLGTIEYAYANTAGFCLVSGSCEPEGPEGNLSQEEPDLAGDLEPSKLFLDKTPGLKMRTETDPFTNRSSATTYSRLNFYVNKTVPPDEPDTNRVVRRTTVISPGNDDGFGKAQHATRYYFHVGILLDDVGQSVDNGIELDRRYFDGADPASGPLVRTIISYSGYKAADGTLQSYHMSDRTPPGQTVTWFGAKSGNQDGTICPDPFATTRCVKVTNSDYESIAGKYKKSRTTSNLTGNVDRTVETNWTPVNNATDWLLDIYDHRFAWDGPTLPGGTSDGQAVVRQYFSFDLANGFLKESRTWDSVADKVIKNCRYNGGSGMVTGEFSQTYTSAAEPSSNACPGSMPSIPSDSDTFGKDHAWTNLLMTKSNWRSGAGTIGWNSFDVTRDAKTGAISTSRDANAALATTYTYDALGRIVMIQPPGGPTVEWPTTICYLSGAVSGPTTYTPFIIVKKTTASPILDPNNANGICKRDDGTPSAYSGSVEGYQYDGFGRLIREIRRFDHALSTGSYFARRESRYDSAGHRRFLSDWQPCPTGSGPTSISSCALPQVVDPLALPTPGTWSLNFDPFGRRQRFGDVNGPNIANDVWIDRTDNQVTPNVSFSDSKEKVTTYCVNGTWSVSTCNGGVASNTVTAKDALGRVTKVTEPNAVTGTESTTDTTSYSYNILDKISQVTQNAASGSQTRSFPHYAFGFLKSETTPENGASGGGTTNYSLYGSIGNLRTKTDGNPSSTQYNYTCDPAGRLTLLTTGVSPALTTYLVNCYDGTATCGDPSVSNFGGGSFPKGRLTRRVGWNQVGFPAAPVFDDFSYSTAGSGRLSSRTTSIGQRNGVLTLAGFGAPVTQSWTYNTQGLTASHIHPRAVGASTSLTVNDPEYTSGLVTRVSAGWQGGGSQQIVTAKYHESGRISSYTTGSPTTVTTTISPGVVIPSRLSQISSSAGGFNTGTYTYDGAGNIKVQGSDTFTYDARSRITQADYGTPVQNFTYDRYGNLVAKAGTSFCTVTCTNNRITGASYDDRGNMKSYSGEALAYDLLNRQISEVKGGLDYSYLYDGAGERVGKFPNGAGALRREFARIIIEARGDSGLTCTNPGPFTDVSCAANPNDGKYIQKMKDLGLTSGCGGGNYCPDIQTPRDQSSVFFLKGKHGGSYVPPSCASTHIFNDVPCPPTPTAPYGDWIGQLYVEGITAGCGGNNFCPTVPLGSWQMLAWAQKTWPNYNPVPRVTVLTFRDDKARVTTEAHSASSTGDGSQTEVYERDNVFLGSQVISSAVWSGTVPAWQFYSSDHLGSPRLTTNTLAQTLETKKYWPYGDQASSTGNSTQRLKFATMERDDEANHFYDHARTHDYGLGRFTSPDTVGGRPISPQSWNRYAYALGNPLKFIDPDGRVAVGFTGLWNSRGSGIHKISGSFSKHPEISPSLVFRSQDVNRALAFVLTELRTNPGQPVVVFGHSEGAASAIRLAKTLQRRGVQVDLLLTIDPVMIDPMASQRVPANVKHATNYWENVSSFLGGIWLVGGESTEIENRRVALDHGHMDDWVAGASTELERLMSIAVTMHNEREKDKKRSECATDPASCPN